VRGESRRERKRQRERENMRKRVWTTTWLPPSPPSLFSPLQFISVLLCQTKCAQPPRSFPFFSLHIFNPWIERTMGWDGMEVASWLLMGSRSLMLSSLYLFFLFESIPLPLLSFTIVSLFLSLSLTHSHTHAHAHALSLSLSFASPGLHRFDCVH